MALTVAAVEAAIEKVLNGQSYTLPDGRSVTRADLAELWKLRQQLKKEEGGGRVKKMQVKM